MRALRLLVLLFLPLIAHAELPPSAYEAMQAKAGELVKIDVLRVDVEPGQEAGQQKVHLIAQVAEVTRTSTNLQPNDIVNILYTVTEHPKGWVGPGQIPLLAEKDSTIAYLTKMESGDYTPAAGRMSFSNF